MSATRISPVSFLKHAAEVASFYGFRPAREVEKSVQVFTKSLSPTKQGEERSRVPSKTGRAHSFATVSYLCATHAHLRPQEPVLAFYATPTPSHLPPGLLSRETGEFGLQVVGSPESVGEIVLLKTTATILSEWGAGVSRVRVNALGDKDSQQRFARELGLHVRKNLNRLAEACRVTATQNPYAIYWCTDEGCIAVRSEAPRPLSFLSERSRSHFREVLEHLENLGLPYELDDSLVGDDRTQHIMFAIDLADGDATVVTAIGGRYDEYLRQQVRRRDGAGVGASIFFRKKGAAQSTFTAATPAFKPRVYFAQLGLRAKLQGLTVVDMLRAARVPVLQSFDASRLSSQLAAAQAQGVSHLIIMGQREVLDGTVIVRSMQNSAQSTIMLSEFPRFLKTLR
jgi:histidyl-tRNA synthetase